MCWNDTTYIDLEIPHIGSLTLIPIGGRWSNIEECERIKNSWTREAHK
jgi:hypothetical protein